MKRKLFTEVYTPHFDERTMSGMRFAAILVLSMISGYFLNILVIFFGEYVQGQFLRDIMDIHNMKKYETGIYEEMEQIKLEVVYFVMIASFVVLFSMWILKRQRDKFLSEAKESLVKYPQLFNEWEEIEGKSKPYSHIVCILVAVLKILGIVAIVAFLMFITVYTGRRCFYSASIDSLIGSPLYEEAYRNMVHDFLMHEMKNTAGLVWGMEISIFFLISLGFFVQLFKIRSSRKRLRNVVSALDAEPKE